MSHFKKLDSAQKLIFKEYLKVTSSCKVDPDAWGKIMDENSFVLHTDSFFPDNFLSEIDLGNNDKIYSDYIEIFEELINNQDTTERDVLNFLSDDKQFIVASIIKNFTIYGHHDRYIFKEFELPPHHICDYLIIGKNSDGYHFLLVELENVYKKISIADGDFGETIRKGLNQIDDWKIWIDKNFHTFSSNLKRYKSELKTLPDEFNEYDSSRFSYCFVAGRREDFKDKTYRKIRELSKHNIIITHYDKLIEESKNLLQANRY